MVATPRPPRPAPGRWQGLRRPSFAAPLHTLPWPSVTPRSRWIWEYISSWCRFFCNFDACSLVNAIKLKPHQSSATWMDSASQAALLGEGRWGGGGGVPRDQGGETPFVSPPASSHPGMGTCFPGRCRHLTVAVIREDRSHPSPPEDGGLLVSSLKGTLSSVFLFITGEGGKLASPRLCACTREKVASALLTVKGDLL